MLPERGLKRSSEESTADESLHAKRARVEQPKPQGPDLPPVSPTLVPSLPRPMPPSNTSASAAEEMAFFDRVKKHVANKQTYNEFLKVCNLFTQDMIDKNTLMHKAYNFIGNNNELVNWFKEFLKYDGSDEIIDNKPKAVSSKVTLSNCRGLGPSYRLVPIAAKQDMHCSGRDETCMKVLNDDWTSFPTWASEDSGFIAHRKNAHEEALSRCEEERHDYDINIEACNRTIQLMEPIVNQIKLKSADEQRAYRLPPGIGGMSETIYERVIKKIYGRDVGAQVIIDMFAMPSAVLPLLVWRLNQKVEEWKASMVGFVIWTFPQLLLNFFYSASGTRSGVSRQTSNSGRVLIIKASLPSRHRPRASFSQSSYSPKSRPYTKSNAVNDPSHQIPSRSINSNTISMTSRLSMIYVISS